MFGDVNRVELLGNITQDPELKYTASGTAVMSIGLATNRRVKKDDNWTDETDFHNLVFWGNVATGLASRIHKGTRMYVAGRLQTRSWDGQDGKKNYRTEVQVGNMQDVVLIARYEGAKDSGGSGSNFDSAPTPTNAPADIPIDDVKIDPDDLPF